MISISHVPCPAQKGEEKTLSRPPKTIKSESNHLNLPQPRPPPLNTLESRGLNSSLNFVTAGSVDANRTLRNPLKSEDLVVEFALEDVIAFSWEAESESSKMSEMSHSKLGPPK
jgi:hypothetical protein